MSVIRFFSIAFSIFSHFHCEPIILPSHFCKYLPFSPSSSFDSTVYSSSIPRSDTAYTNLSPASKALMSSMVYFFLSCGGVGALSFLGGCGAGAGCFFGAGVGLGAGWLLGCCGIGIGTLCSCGSCSFSFLNASASAPSIGIILPISILTDSAITPAKNSFLAESGILT